MSLEGKRISELTEVSRVNKSSKLPIDTGGEEALSITLENLMESGVNAAIESLQLITWVDVLPPTGSTKYLYVVPREEVDKDGKKIAALYLWDSTEWRGAGAFSLNIDPDTLATKTELAGYLPLSGGTLTGVLKINTQTDTKITLQHNNNSCGFLYAYGTSSNPAVIISNNTGQAIGVTKGSGIYLKKKDGEIGQILCTLDKAVANGVASLDANAKVPVAQIPDLSSTYATINSLATVATSGSYNDLADKPTIPSVGNAEIEIQKNGTKVDSFTLNQTLNKIINITVPTKASDLAALPDSTKYAASMTLSIDSDTYVITAQLKDQDGANLGTAQIIDLPLESVVVSGSYDKTNKKIVLTLQSGSTVDVPVGDLIAGLQTQITSTNKLSADLIADGTTNKVVTATEKNTWNGKQAAISDLATIRSGASKGATAVQPGDLATVATSGSYTDLANKPTIPTVDSALSSTSTNAIQNKVVNTALAGKANATHTHASGDIKGLAKVATSGSYTDLTNKPTIPAAVTETTVSGWGFTKNAGTVTSVKINGTAKNPTSGVVDLGTVITAHQDISGKQDKIADLEAIRSGAEKGATALQSYTETDPTVPAHVKAITTANISSWNAKQPAGDYATKTEVEAKQDKLIAGTNITIKGNVISATGGSGSGDTIGLNIGDVVSSYSNLASENPGKLPLFTGETITSANTIYPEFYNWVLAHTELQCTSEEYESALTTYGECAKYVIGGGSLRLPLIKNYIKAANPSEGIKNIEAGLPNITGSIDPYVDMNRNWSGAFSVNKTAPFNPSGTSGNGNGSHVMFDASKSNAIYGASNTVQPASTTLYPWVVAYTAAIPASTAQAAEFQQALSGKADTNLGNLSVAGKDLASGLGMPSNRYTDLTLGASDATYTAPANGYFCLKGNSGINGNFQISFYNQTANFRQSVSDNNWADWVSTYIPAKKGDVVNLLYTNVTASSHNFLFIYAEGAE